VERRSCFLEGGREKVHDCPITLPTANIHRFIGYWVDVTVNVVSSVSHIISISPVGTVVKEKPTGSPVFCTPTGYPVFSTEKYKNGTSHLSATGWFDDDVFDPLALVGGRW
jgi:hypothetical protein